MKGKKLTIYIGFAILMVVLSFVIYFGFSNVEKTTLQNIAFSFTIISELVFFIMIYLATRENNNTFSKSGIISASVIYILLGVILNIFAQSIFSTVRMLVTSNVILLILYVGTILLIYLAKKER